MSAPICPYCNKPAEMAEGTVIYPSRPDLYLKKFWLCSDCWAYVGCHEGTDKPLGRLADEKLRAAKQRAHAAFDPLWRAKVRNGAKKKQARGSGYRWLSEQLGIKFEDCHIGEFDVATCERVVEICKPHLTRLQNRRMGSSYGT